MTNYYYLASDQNMRIGNGSLEFLKIEPVSILGFDYPVQLEIFNGVEKAWELRELHQYILNHTARYETCTIQIANLLNSVCAEFKVREKRLLLLHEITENKQLLLNEGHLLTIKKVPV